MSNMDRLALDNLDIGVFVVDKTGKYIYVNDAYLQLSDYPREFYDSMTLEKLRSQVTIDNAAGADVFKTKSTVYSIVTITDPQKERIYDLVTTAVPIFDDDGEIQYVLYMQEMLTDLAKRVQKGMTNKSYRNANTKESARASRLKIIAESPQMKAIIATLDSAAKRDAPVFLSGPTGSGKEVLANYIHQQSDRAKKPFVAVNCAAIPENLFESELFGYEKGAFTGASASGKIGLVEAANGGTLFIDEINSLSIQMQIKLLRVLETKQITRIGATAPKEIDFRLICAANEDIPKLIGEKKFRSDLFYRINVIDVSIPPLCKRREDILPLINHFVAFFCQKYSCIKTLSAQIITYMQGYSWPGNVRELRNLVEKMIATSLQNELEIKAVPFELLSQQSGSIDLPESREDALTLAANPSVCTAYNGSETYKQYMDKCEKALIRSVLIHCQSVAKAAETLEMDVSSLYRKIKKHGLEKVETYI